MRDYDEELLLKHFGVPGMKRPNGLKYKARRGSTDLYSLRRAKMHPKARISEEPSEESSGDLAHEDKNQNDVIKRKINDSISTIEYPAAVLVINKNGDEAEVTMFDKTTYTKDKINEFVNSLQKEKR